MHAYRLGRQPSGQKELKKYRSLSVCAQRMLLLMLVAFFFNGCMVGPDYVKPTAPETKEWLEDEDPKIKAQEGDYSDWWTVFDDPVLDNLIEMAYNQNLTLQIAGIRILQARAVLGVAGGRLYPQQQQVTGNYSREGLSDETALPVFDRYFSNWQVGFDAAWELDFWGKFRRGVQSAGANLGATIADYDEVLISLLAEVAATYVLIRTFEDRLELARQNVEIQQRTLQITQVRFDAGLVTELDVQQAKSVLSDTQALIPLLETGLRQSKNGLSVLLGMPPSDLQDVLGGSGPIPNAPPEVAVGIPADLLRRRPDIARAEREAAAQSARIGVAKADFYPHVSIAGAIGFQADDIANLFTGNAFTGFISPGFRWDVLHYGRIMNRVRIQDAGFQELIVAYWETVLRAYREVEDAMVAFLRAQDRVKYLTEGVTATKRSLDLSLIQYRDGLVDFIRVLDAQRLLVTTQDRLAETQGDVARNLIAMYKALGGGWQIRVGKDFVSPDIMEIMRERTNWGDLLTPEELEAPPPAEKGKSLQEVRWPDW